MRSTINPAEFDQVGDIQQAAETMEHGVVDDTYTTLYANVRAKRLLPLRGSESEETQQQVAVERNSWLIRNEHWQIVPKKMIFLVDSRVHVIYSVRPYKGERFYLVLDTEYRDN